MGQETRRACTQLLPGRLIKKTLNLEPICSFLAPFSHRPDLALKKREHFKRWRVAAKIAGGQRVNFLIKGPHKSNFLFLSALCVFLKCCFKLKELFEYLPHPLSLSVSQLISLDPEVCSKWFFFFCLKGKRYFMQKKFLFLGHAGEWQPHGSLESRHSWPRTENPGQSTEAI